MTEAEAVECEAAWEAHEWSEDSWRPMVEDAWPRFSELEYIWGDARLWPSLTHRKCRLLAAACCRRIWRHIPAGESRRVVEAMERTEDEESAEWGILRRFYESPIGSTRAGKEALSAVAACCAETHIELTAIVARHCLLATRVSGEGRNAWNEEKRAQCDLLRDILCNPFRPVTFDPAWRTDTAVLLARRMYEMQDFGAMPILADALQDAGCDNEDALNHCRDAGVTHVRGCWAADLVLGKA